jgi:hypothetical protein
MDSYCSIQQIVKIDIVFIIKKVVVFTTLYIDVLIYKNIAGRHLLKLLVQ